MRRSTEQEFLGLEGGGPITEGIPRFTSTVQYVCTRVHTYVHTFYPMSTVGMVRTHVLCLVQCMYYSLCPSSQFVY